MSPRGTAGRAPAAPDLKLYYSPGACSLAPHVVLNELALPHALERVSIAAGQHRTDAFLAINPNGRVPVLRAEGEWLTEAPAILMHLALSDPRRRLLPAAPLAVARCLEWLNWLSTDLHAVAFAQLWRGERFVDDPTLVGPVNARGRHNMLVGFAAIEQRLPASGWAVGGQYTVVDPFLLVFHRWGHVVGLDMAVLFPRWAAHAAAVAARPAVRATLAIEGISIG